MNLDGKTFVQYESVFLQLADEHRTVNAFELQELLDACLPNGKTTFTNARGFLAINIQTVFKFTDYIKSCASMEVCRQVVITLDVSAVF